MIDRKTLKEALAKPLPLTDQCISSDEFSPWDDVISGIHGVYSSESDSLMIEALEAVRDGETFEFRERVGFAGEFALYVLSGHGLLEYGTSPRGGWPDPEFADLWNLLIEKWRGYFEAVWDQPFVRLPTVTTKNPSPHDPNNP